MLGAALKEKAPFWLAVAGLALSLLLEFFHVRAYGAPSATSFCAIGARVDCTTVALSHWSVLLGVPVPLWGALGFLALAIAAWLGSAWLVPLALAAAAASLVLLGVEVFVIGALCILCEAVHALGVALAVVAWRRRTELAPLGDRDHATLVLSPPVGILVTLLLFLPTYYRQVVWRGALPFAEGVMPDGAPWIGARSPSLTLEEYTDYLCPHCAAATAWTLHRLAERPEDIRIVRRQAPAARCNARRKDSCERVRMAYCAGEQGRFWQMDRWLFAHQREQKLELAAAARDVGIRSDLLASCVQRADIHERAQRESDASAALRFPGTPAYVVKGKRIPSSTADRFLAQGHPD